MIGWIKSVVTEVSGLISGFTVAPVRGLCHGRMFMQQDGTTDLSRVLGALVILAFIAYQGYAVIALKQAFDPSAFGTGAAALLAGAGVFILTHDHARQ
ncbi:MAG: hypothetical protein KGL39_28500 [Patescibacteria group bacterium]|nr:hypothetical protein [Patescibacteria group bacterium]